MNLEKATIFSPTMETDHLHVRNALFLFLFSGLKKYVLIVEQGGLSSYE